MQTNGHVRLEGAAPADTTITVEGAPASGRCRALVLAMLPDDALPNHGPGAASSGNFILTRVRVALVTEGQPETQLEFTNARATFEGQTGYGIFEHGCIGPHAPSGFKDLPY